MVSHFYLGQLLEAREQGNRVLALYDPQRAGRWMQLTGQDLRTSVGVYLVSLDLDAGLPGPGRADERGDGRSCAPTRACLQPWLCSDPWRIGLRLPV